MNKSCFKTCLRCGSGFTKKDGKRRGRQSYKCKRCLYVWISKHRKKTKANISKLYRDFSIHKQNYKELSDSHKISIKTVQKYLDLREFRKKEVKPSKVVLLIDTTYFGTFGLMVFKDAISKDILNYKIVEYEKNEEYREGIQELINEGWKVEAIVSDGRRGLLGMFQGIPSQMCHFHQQKIIRKYITKRPKLTPNKELKETMKRLHKTDKGTFEIMLDNWYNKNERRLKERSESEEGKRCFKHRRTRSAYFSLKRNLKYLFTYLDYMGTIDIPNTTNGIEGVFSHLKDKVRLHRGLRKDRKIKLILNLLHN